MRYAYPVRLEADKDGRLVVRFPDLAVAGALTEASDCLSEALAGWIRRQEARTPLANFEAAVSALGYTIGIDIRETRVA